MNLRKYFHNLKEVEERAKQLELTARELESNLNKTECEVELLKDTLRSYDLAMSKLGQVLADNFGDSAEEWKTWALNSLIPQNKQ